MVMRPTSAARRAQKNA